MNSHNNFGRFGSHAIPNAHQIKGGGSPWINREGEKEKKPKKDEATQADANPWIQ